MLFRSPGTVTAFSDGQMGLKLRLNSLISHPIPKKHDPRCYTLPDGNVSIKVSYGDEDLEDMCEGLGITSDGGFGDTDLESGSVPPRRGGARGPDGSKTYDEDAWGGKGDRKFRDRADGEAGGGGREPAIGQAMNVRGQGAPAWT